MGVDARDPQRGGLLAAAPSMVKSVGSAPIAWPRLGVPLARAQLERLEARPAGVEVVLGGRRLQMVDVAQACDGQTGQHRLVAAELPVLLGPQARDRTHRQDGGHGQHDDHAGQQRIVDDHQQQAAGAHRDLDDDPQQLDGRLRGDPADRLDARHQVAGQPVEEELNRKAEETADEAVRLNDR